jgi:hypothetical protein
MSLLPKSRTQARLVQQVMRMMTRWPFSKLGIGGTEKTANAVTLKQYGQPTAVGTPSRR